MVRVLYEERNTRMARESFKSTCGEGSSEDEKYEKNDSKGNGGKPPPSPPYSSSSSSSLSSSSSQTITSSTSTTKIVCTRSKIPKENTPLLKLDIKFELPMYNGEVNVEKLDNWIRKLEVYCRIHNLEEDDIKIQLASLRLEGARLVWWEAKT